MIEKSVLSGPAEERRKAFAHAAKTGEAKKNVRISKRDHFYCDLLSSKFGGEVFHLEQVAGLGAHSELAKKYDQVHLIKGSAYEADTFGWRLQKLGLMTSDDDFGKFRLTDAGIECAKAAQK